MSKMYIQEYEHVAWLARGKVPIPIEPAVASQTVSFTGTAGQSSAFNIRTKFIRVYVDGKANLKFGANPTAVDGSDVGMAADQTEYFALDVFNVAPAGLKVSAVTRT